MGKLEFKLNNFGNAIARLKEAAVELQKNPATDVVRDGLIQRFEFTYELAWKTAKVYLEETGITDMLSPRAVIKEAFAQKLIDNETQWLMMMDDRNRTSHVYQEKMAEEIAARIVHSHIQEFERLLSGLKK